MIFCFANYKTRVIEQNVSNKEFIDIEACEGEEYEE